MAAAAAPPARTCPRREDGLNSFHTHHAITEARGRARLASPARVFLGSRRTPTSVPGPSAPPSPLHTHSSVSLASYPACLPRRRSDGNHGEAATCEDKWWLARAESLPSLVPPEEDCAYVYHLDTVRARARRLRSHIASVQDWYYACKANTHPAILGALASLGFGLECVSLAEVRRAVATLEALEDAAPARRVLFTPNFAPLREYSAVLALGADVVIDGPHLLRDHGAVFAGHAVGLRVDPGAAVAWADDHSHAHHAKVTTAGDDQKFGCAPGEYAAVAEAAATHGVRVRGLHAHVGSGILDDPNVWGRVLAYLAGLVVGTADQPAFFPDVEWIDVGGGLGVVERPGQRPLDLDAVERGLQHGWETAHAAAPSEAAREALGRLRLRMEPGRYCVAPAGVLLSRVTQVRTKGLTRFVGLATGMNSLVRPAMYDAHHPVVNLTRLPGPAHGGAATATGAVVEVEVEVEEDLVPSTVVGPICESGDVVNRLAPLPRATREDDWVLVANGGAYGFVMGSAYNLRPTATEVVIP